MNITPIKFVTPPDMKLTQIVSPPNLPRELWMIASACVEKTVDELTNSEKFAIAYAAGVPLDYRHNAFDRSPDGKLTLKTLPCGITKIDGVFHVAYCES